VGEGIAVHGHGTVDLDLLADGDTAVSGAAPGGGVRAAGDALYGGGHLDVEALGSRELKGVEQSNHQSVIVAEHLAV
jgi:hypothetical protein